MAARVRAPVEISDFKRYSGIPILTIYLGIPDIFDPLKGVAIRTKTALYSIPLALQIRVSGSESSSLVGAYQQHIPGSRPRDNIVP